MNRLDPTTEELLSAYLDGELTVAEQQLVEALLVEDPDARRWLEQMRGLSGRFQALESFSLGDDFHKRVVGQIDSEELLSAHFDAEVSEDEVAKAQRLAGENREWVDDLNELRADFQASPTFSLGTDFSERVAKTIDSEELLSAHFDAEVSEDEGAKAQRLADENREWVDDLNELRAEFQSSPTFSLDVGFSERVLQAAEAAKAEQLGQENQPVPLDRDSDHEKSSRWQGVVWTAVAIAAAILIAINLPKGDDEVAKPDNKGKDQDVASTKPLDAPKMAFPVKELIAQQIEQNGIASFPDKEIKPTIPFVPPRGALVSAIDPLTDLILVYELVIDPAGAESNAFAELLRRNRVRFANTVAVNRQDEDAILESRFMEGVERAEGNRDNMDEVDLYVVRCTGETEERIWRDLRFFRVGGVKNFRLNLAKINGKQGAVKKLCEAARGTNGLNQAVSLMSQFAILSNSNRNWAVAGKIDYDPSLINENGQQDSQPKKQAQPARNAEARKWEQRQFDILFVVRKLKPLSEEQE